MTIRSCSLSALSTLFLLLFFWTELDNEECQILLRSNEVSINYQLYFHSFKIQGLPKDGKYLTLQPILSALCFPLYDIWLSKGENIGVVGLLFCDLISLFTSLCRQWTNNQLAHGWLISVCKIKMKWWTKCGDRTDEYLVWKSHKTRGRGDLLLLYAHLSLPKLLSWSFPNEKEIFDVCSESYGEGLGYKRIWSVNVNMRNMITRLIWWTSKRIHKDESLLTLNKYQVSLINALFTTDLLILKRSNL